MIKKKNAGSFESQADDFIREEALRIARANQAPGQTKEQTKLIAKGIAKGITEYKKQESTKQRERAKLQRKRKPAATAAIHDSDSQPDAGPLNPSVNKLPGLTAAGIFLLAAVFHLVRLVTGTEITIGAFPVPRSWSGVAAAVALVLAIWIYRSTQEAVWVSRQRSPGSTG
jgi:Protein of unknown function (DUF2956)